MTSYYIQDAALVDKQDERVEDIFRELELSIQWNRSIILFAVYGSEYVRQEIQSDLENHLFDIGQETVHIKLCEHVGQNLSQFLLLPQDLSHKVFIISSGNLSSEAQKRCFRVLNDQRDYFIENNIRALFWLTQSEIIKLARIAPEFWSFRHWVAEFAESPKKAHLLSSTLDSIWQGIGEYDDQSSDADEKISFREALLSNLPESPESNSIRANMLLTLGVLHWRKGDFEKSTGLLEEAIKLALKIDNKWLEAECLNAQALLFTSMGRVDQAIDAYKQAIRLLPDQIFAWNNLGNLCARIGRNDEAIVTFSKAIECNPEDSVAWNGLGNVYTKIGYFDDAITSYRKSIQYTPSFAQPWNGLGDVYALMGRLEEAVRAFEQSIALNRNYLNPLMGLGRLNLKQEKYRESIKIFQRALFIDVSNAEIWNQLGVAQLNCNELDAAERSFKNAIKIDRTFGSSYLNLGTVYSMRQDYDQAISLFRKSLNMLKDAKDQSVVWNNLGDLYRNMNKYNLAMQAYKNADTKSSEERLDGLADTKTEIEDLPSAETGMEQEEIIPRQDPISETVDIPLVEVKDNKASSIEDLGKTEVETFTLKPPSWITRRVMNEEQPLKTENSKGDNMVELLNKTDQLNSGLEVEYLSNNDSQTGAIIWNEMGNEHFRSENYSEAIIAYNKAVHKDPNFGMPYANMGLISLLQERYSEAILLYKKSIQTLGTDQEKAVAYNGLGNAYRGVGDYENTMIAYRKAAELDPISAGLRDHASVFNAENSSNNPEFWHELGNTFMKTGTYNEAITALKRAAELSPMNGKVHQKLGMSYAYAGKYVEAVSAYTKSINLLDDNKEKADSLNHLGNVYRKLNNYDKAIESLQKAVVLNDEGVNLVTRARFSLLSNCYAEKA